MQNVINLNFKSNLTHKQLEMHVCVLNILATDAFVLKKDISNHSIDHISIVFEQIHAEILQLLGTTSESKII